MSATGSPYAHGVTCLPLASKFQMVYVEVFVSVHANTD